MGSNPFVSRTASAKEQDLSQREGRWKNTKSGDAALSQLALGQDAMLNVGFQAHWQHIKECKQCLINQNNKWENVMLELNRFKTL